MFDNETITFKPNMCNLSNTELDNLNIEEVSIALIGILREIKI